MKKQLQFLILGLFFCNLGYLVAQEMVPLSSRKTINRVKGNLIMTGNSIVGLTDSDSDDITYDPNAAFNGTLNNGNSISAYIDIDGSGNDTFSSSSADITIPRPDCSKITYAGLYWAATYYIERVAPDGNEQLTGLPLVDARKVGAADFRKIKFKVPGAGYMDVTAQNIIYDGYRNTPTNPSNNATDDVPYVCYANVTDLINQTQTIGTYTVANMNATIGRTSGTSGAAGGWTLVIIYEDPNESSKYISTNDGFVQIRNSDPPVDFTYTGFTSLHGTQPVEVRYGVAALEGDKSLANDRLRIKNTSGNFVSLGNGSNTVSDVNPINNFFNSSITFNQQHVTTRNPASQNTLGLDIDLFDLPNTGNVLIGNNQKDATFRLETDQDTYRVFLNAFATEIVEPEVKIIKRIYDVSGISEITGANVELGDELFYELEIENTGNEDLVDGMVTITSFLPANTDLIEVQDTTLPIGVTYIVTPGNKIDFSIPANIVEVNDSSISIRYKVRLVNSCAELRDVCSNEIKGTDAITFTGAISGIIKTNNSSNTLDSCGNPNGEAVNFLVNVPACSSDITLCNKELQLVAGEGYDKYTWSGPGISSPVITINNSYTVSNPQIGTYNVKKENNSGGCMSLTEEFVVDEFSHITNPILDYINGATVISTNCSGLEIPQILLCGNQTFDLATNFDPATLNSISWQQLTPSGSCVLDSNDPCSLLSDNCTDINWVELPGGNTPSYNVSNTGDYRILAEFEGGCSIPFFFSVFKQDYQPTLDMTPIECGNDGSVSVTNAPNHFEFSLTQGGPYNAVTVFSIAPGAGGDIIVYGIDTTFPGCEYTATINVPEINPTFSVTSIDPTCINDNNGTGMGSIQIQVTDGFPEYQYTISGSTLTTPIIIPNSSANNGNYIQNNLEPGTYDVEIISNLPSPSCVYIEQVTINPEANFEAEVVLLAPSTCDTGALVQINVVTGPGDYLYDDGSGNFQTNNIFEVTSPNPEATYSFFVSDNSLPPGTPACTISADIAGLIPYKPIQLDAITVTQPECFGDAGLVQVEVSSVVPGREYTYQLLNTTDKDPLNPVYPVVDQIVTTSANVTFVDVTDFSDYRIRVFHKDTAIPEGTLICSVEGTDFSITSPDVITADISISRELSCSIGNEDVLVRVENITGGSGAYEWSFNASSVFTSIVSQPFDIPVATEGSYTIYIRNQGTNDCTVSFPITINPRQEIDDINYVIGSSSCTNQTIVVTPVAFPEGVPYIFSVTPTPNSGDAISGFELNRGTNYTFTATNPNSDCRYSEDFREDLLPEIEIINAIETSPVSCFGDSNGELSFTVENSTSFDYIVTGVGSSIVISGTGIGDIPITVSSLIAGTYTVEVIDTNIATGVCTAVSTVNITETEELIITTVTEGASCNVNDGIITVVATGGAGPYEYELRDATIANVVVPYQTDNVFTGLASGNYTIAVRDGNTAEACEVIKEVGIIAIDAPTINLAVGGNSCYDIINRASQWITIIPGNAPTGPFVYSIDGGTPIVVDFLRTPANTFEVSNLTPGVHTVTVTNEASTCISNTVNFTINPELIITANLTKEIDCNSGAEIIFEATGGDGFYTYDIVNRDISAVFLTDVTSPIAINEGGNYEVQVTDGFNCSVISTPVTIEPYNDIMAAITTIEPQCFNDEGSIEVFVTDGDGPFIYVLDGSTIVGPTIATTGTFNNVSVGAHNITVTDQYGCSVDLNAVISEPSIISVTSSQTNYGCNVSGVETLPVITLTINGGSSPYGVSYTGPTSGTETDIADADTGIPGIQYEVEGTIAGTYTFTVSDNNGCTSSFDVIVPTFSVLPEPIVVRDITATNGGEISCTNPETISVTVTGGVGPFNFEEVSGAIPSQLSTEMTTTFALPNVGTYTFRITDTATGCSVDSSPYDVAPFDTIDMSLVTVSNAGCNQTKTGVIELTILGYTGEYAYFASNSDNADIASGIGNTSTNPLLISGLSAGNYVVIIDPLDTPFCPIQSSIVVNEVSSLQTTIVEITPESCYSNSTGSATIEITAGTPPYETNITNNDADFVVNKLTYNTLPGGITTIYIRDAGGCRMEIPVDVPFGVNLNASISSRTDCAIIDPNSGEVTKEAIYHIDIIVEDNVLAKDNFIYTIQGINGTPDPIGSTNTTGTFIVEPGEYRGVVEAFDCLEFAGNITIKEQIPLEVSVTGINATAIGNNGEVIVKVEQGKEPYTFILDNSEPIIRTIGSHVFNDVPVGNHQVIVYDAAGCTSGSIDVEIEQEDKNPITDYAYEILLCTLTGQSYPVISIEDQNGETLEVSLSDAVSIVWQKLDDISCTIELENNCPTTDSSCSSNWFNVQTGTNCTITEEGEYRIVVTFANKTGKNTKVYYFKVESNLPDITDDFVMYPNPSKDIVNVNAEIKNVQLFDMMGKLVLETTKQVYSVADLPDGIYFARIQMKNNQEIVIKLMKE